MADKKVPLKRTLFVIALALATNVDGNTIIGIAPFDGTVAGVDFVPNAAITGQNTDTRRVAIVNKGQAGVGTAEPAALQFNAGVNAAAFDAKALTISAVAVDIAVVAGDVLVVASTTPGVGLADPGGLFVLTIAR